MSDLISRSKIYNYIKAQINPFGKPFEGDVYEFGVKLMGYIEQMDTEESVTDTNVGSKWIPCSERLPKVEDLHDVNLLDCTQYLIQRRCGVMDVAHYIRVYGASYFEANTMVIKDVIAWMPLPTPYKAEQT